LKTAVCSTIELLIWFIHGNCVILHPMALSKEDLNALQLLIREEVRTELHPFRDEMSQFRNEVATNFDALFKRDEKREQEYLVMREQIGRLEKKVA